MIKLNKICSHRLAVGAAQFGLEYGISNTSGMVRRAGVAEIMSVAKCYGIDVIDTAIAYGISEEVIGQVGADGFSVVTKLPSIPVHVHDLERWVWDHVYGSLARLKQKTIYGLLIHNSKDLWGCKGQRLAKVLLDVKKSGIVKKIGVSIYNPDELDKVFQAIQLDLVQAPLNVVDRRLELSGWLDRLKNSGVEIHSRSVFLQGLLLLRKEELPRKFEHWASLWEQWRLRLDASDLSPLAACLEYPLSLRQVDRIIIGFDKPGQLIEILQAAVGIEMDFDSSFMISDDLNLINPSKWPAL